MRTPLGRLYNIRILKTGLKLNGFERKLPQFRRPKKLYVLFIDLFSVSNDLRRKQTDMYPERRTNICDNQGMGWRYNENGMRTYITLSSCRDHPSPPPHKPHFKQEKMGFAGVYIIFHIFCLKHRLRVHHR